MSMDELIRVKNLSKEPFRDTYLGERTTILPGHEAPWIRREAAILWFGNPEKIDHYENNELHEDRTKECDRLDNRYGIFPVRLDELGKVQARTREDSWPKVKVSSMDGAEIRMVIHDPSGETVEHVSETRAQRRVLLDTIEELKERVERFEAQAASSAQPPAEGEVDVVEDLPQGRRGKSA